MKLKKRRAKRAAALRVKRELRQQLSPKHRYLRAIVATVLAAATLVGIGIELYEFEIVNPHIEPLSVGLNAPFSFRVVNNSYVDFPQLSPICDFPDLAWGTNQSFGLNTGGDLPKDIAVGRDRISSCKLGGNGRAAGNVTLTLNYFVHCIPFIHCSRQSIYHLRSLPDGTWVEGETFSEN